jgi:hypothetical protein
MDEAAGRRHIGNALDDRGLPVGSSDAFVRGPGLVADDPDSAAEAVRAYGQAVAKIEVPHLDYVTAFDWPVLQNERTATLESATGLHRRFRQLVRGRRLLGSSFAFHVAEGSAFAITGLVVADASFVDPGPPRRRSAEDVEDAVRSALELPGETKMAVELVALPTSRWAWEARVIVRQNGRPTDLRVYLDNDSLGLLWISDVMVAAAPAMAYLVNPRRTPSLIPTDLAPVGPPPDYLLSSADLDVTPAPASGRLRQRGLSFELSPSDAGFDEVQAFHHLRAGLAFYASLVPAAVFEHSGFRPLRATVRDPDDDDNAFFEPSTGRLRFGDFGGARPSARSGDIVVHEMGHAVSHAITDWGEAKGQQTKAINEAVADYFSASLCDGPRIGDYVVEDAPELVRDLSRPPRRLPADLNGEEHAMGEILGGLLWQLRDADRAQADRCAAEALQYLHPTSTITEWVAALRVAQTKLDPGDAAQFRPRIDAEWAQRKPL